MRDVQKILWLVTLIAFISCQKVEQPDLPIKHTVIPEGFVQKAIPYSLFKENLDKRFDYERIVSGGKLMTDKQKERIYIRVWNDLFMKALLEPEVQYLGLEITPYEIEELLFGENAHESMRSLQFLKDASGNFSPSLARNFVAKIQTDTAYSPRLTWEVFFDDLLLRHLKEKHSSIIKNTYYFTPAEKKFFDEYFSTEIDFDYVFLNYQNYVMQTPPDSVVAARLYYPFIEDYFKPELRRISYIMASPKIDSINHPEELKRFLAVKNHSNADFRTLADKNEELKYYSAEYKTETGNRFLRNFFINNDAGSIIGPYFFNNSFNYLRIAEKYERPDSVRIRIIALKQSDAAKVPQLMEELSQKDNFADLASKYSIHEQTASKGGDMGWVAYGSLPEPFNTACFSAPQGRIFELPGDKTTYIIQVTDISETSTSYVFAEGLVYQLKPNDKDRRNTEIMLRKIARKAKSSDDLFAAAVANGFATQNLAIQNTYYVINEIPDSHDIVQWCFSNPTGVVSPLFLKDDNYYLFTVNEIIPTGYVPIAEVIDPLRSDYIILARRDSLVDMYREKFIPGRTLKEYGQLFRTDVTSVNNAKMISYMLPQVGTEPLVKGVLYGMRVGEISDMLKGDKGLFAVQKRAQRKIVPTTDPAVKIEKQFVGDVSTETHLGNISYAAKPFMNFVRRQDSYYLSKEYPVQLDNDPTMAQQMMAAEFLFRNQRWQEALEGSKGKKGFVELIAKAGKNSRQLRLAKIYAGICYMKLGKYTEAIDVLSTIEPTHDFYSGTFIPMMIGDAYSFLGKADKAIENYTVAVSQGQSAFYKPVLYIKLIVYHINNGNIEEAYKWAAQYKELHIESTFTQTITELHAYLDQLVHSRNRGL